MIIKRLVDIVVSAVALLLLSPVLIVVAVMVRLRMGTPVLFRQARAGRNGAPFEMLKFRTMRDPLPGEDAPVFDMQRITALGRVLRRTSIDELPSLINVLRGDMSLVGPRPLPVEYVGRYSAQQARRLEVRPGLTGWAVVHGRNQLDWADRFELDVWYVDHQSLLLDCRVLVRTVGLVLRGSGVNHDASTTMTEFRGESVAPMRPGLTPAAPSEPALDHG